MSEVVKKVIESGVSDKLMEKALTYLNSAEAFASKEVPAYINELLEFKIFEHLVSYFDDLIIILIIISVVAFFLKKLNKWVREKNEHGDYKQGRGEREFAHSFTITTLVISLISILLSMGNTGHLVDAYKAYKAPRVYLVDYFKGN